jgi:hypothetical protein
MRKMSDGSAIPTSAGTIPIKWLEGILLTLVANLARIRRSPLTVRVFHYLKAHKVARAHQRHRPHSLPTTLSRPPDTHLEPRFSHRRLSAIARDRSLPMLYHRTTRTRSPRTQYTHQDWVSRYRTLRLMPERASPPRLIMPRLPSVFHFPRPECICLRRSSTLRRHASTPRPPPSTHPPRTVTLVAMGLRRPKSDWTDQIPRVVKSKSSGHMSTTCIKS